MQLRIPEILIGGIMTAANRIPEIINGSGIQILILLAGLQAISPVFYEAAKVEGANSWEVFWMITLPVVSPLILTTIIYTIVDFFTAPTNVVVDLIRQESFGGSFGVGTAMSWIYSLSIVVIVALVFAISSRVIVYQD